MRIRRYAARLLASGATTTNPASPRPPHPAGAWPHAAAAADDDCCAFCDITHSSPQESADAAKHIGHVARRVPESDVKSVERVSLAQGLPAPEAKRCKTDHGPPFDKADAGLGVANEGSIVSEAAVKLEDVIGATLVTKADERPAFKVANDATVEQEVKCGGSPVTDAAKLNVTEENSPAKGSTNELEVLKDVPLADEVASDPEVTERVSLESRADTLPGITGIETDVTGRASIVNESGGELGVLRTASLVNEASTEAELMEGISLMSISVTDAGDTIAAPKVTITGFLSNEGSEGPEVTGGASLVQEAAELETMKDPIASKTARELEDTGRSYCSADDDPALCEAQPPSSTSNSPVAAKDPSTVEGGVARDRSVTPSVSCILDVVARSIGRSGRKDVICYARRKGKKKLDLPELKTEKGELDDGVICDQIEEDETLESNGYCEEVTSRDGSADVKLADIKRELMDNSTARTVKKMKTNKFECDIDYCRMTFKTKSELSVHKKNMCTVKSCSKHFRSHNYLRRHQSVHNDYMPYRCPWEGCSMAFKYSWDRAEHFQVHAGVKPYKCTTPGCSKIYKFVSDFTRHRRRCKPQR